MGLPVSNWLLSPPLLLRGEEGVFSDFLESDSPLDLFKRTSCNFVDMFMWKGFPPLLPQRGEERVGSEFVESDSPCGSMDLFERTSFDNFDIQKKVLS